MRGCAHNSKTAVTPKPKYRVLNVVTFGCLSYYLPWILYPVLQGTVTLSGNYSEMMLLCKCYRKDLYYVTCHVIACAV